VEVLLPIWVKTRTGRMGVDDQVYIESVISYKGGGFRDDEKNIGREKDDRNR